MVGGELWKTNVLLSAFFFPGWVLVDANMNTTVYSWKEWSLVKLLLLFVTGRLFSLTSKTQCRRYSLQRSFKKDLKFLTLQCQLLKILSLLATQSKSNALLREFLITVEMHPKRMNYHCHHFIIVIIIISMIFVIIFIIIFIVVFITVSVIVIFNIVAITITLVECNNFFFDSRLMFGIFFLLNLVLWSEGSSAAVPFTTLLALLAMW